MDTQLKPCPFCGNVAVIYKGNYYEDNPANRMVDPIYYEVSCSDCDATISDCSSEQQAIEAWNKRVDNA